MTAFRGRIVVGGLLVVAVLAVSGCQGSPPGPAATPSASVSASPAATPSELTADEDLAHNPPGPVDVHATVAGGHVELTWQAPPPVTVSHQYSDRVTAYRIYRRGPSEVELRPVGTSTALTYTDSAIPGSGEFAYAVTSIRAGHVEGTKSDPAVLVRVS